MVLVVAVLLVAVEQVARLSQHCCVLLELLLLRIEPVPKPACLYVAVLQKEHPDHSSS